ncbi:MAG: transcription elongation factor GreA [Elusimicrobiota bacterium]
MTEKVYLSRAGFEKLKTDLDILRKEKAGLSIEIGEAASQGDLRENAGYTAAMERQQEVLNRIIDLERKLGSAQLIEEINIPQGEIRIGVKVTLEETPGGDESQWALVGSEEADINEGKISVHAPLSQGLLGHKEGEIVTVHLPRGPITYKILKVARL